MVFGLLLLFISVCVVKQTQYKQDIDSFIDNFIDGSTDSSIDSSIDGLILLIGIQISLWMESKLHTD